MVAIILPQPLLLIPFFFWPYLAIRHFYHASILCCCYLFLHISNIGPPSLWDAVRRTNLSTWIHVRAAPCVLFLCVQVVWCISVRLCVQTGTVCPLLGFGSLCLVNPGDIGPQRTTRTRCPINVVPIEGKGYGLCGDLRWCKMFFGKKANMRRAKFSKNAIR